MTERELQSLVLAAVKTFRLLAYHTFDSRRSQPGFPDLVIVGPGGTLFRELKTEKGRLRFEQEKWLTALTAAGQDAGVWRPSDWPDRVTQELRRLRSS